jgi:hypothetical protein
MMNFRGYHQKVSRAVIASALTDEVKELIRKHDYLANAEPRGDEMTAWRRAAELCAGNPGVH